MKTPRGLPLQREYIQAVSRPMPSIILHTRVSSGLIEETMRYQHISFFQKLSFGSSSPSVGAEDESPFSLKGGKVAVFVGYAAAAPSEFTIRRASTTRRTSTITSASFLSGFLWQLTSKRLLDINHLSCTRFHEPAPSLARPLKTLSCLYHSCSGQITLVARNKLHWGYFALVYPVLLFHIYHLCKVFEALEAVLVCDVVHEEEGVGTEVRGSPERAVLFLPGRVGEHEEVGLAIDGACYGV